MSEIDQYRILTGTLEKKFAFERAKLAEDYDEGSAEDFFYVYKDAALSFILRHSRDIFSETYYGYPFYLNIVGNELLDPATQQSELKKVEMFIAEAKNKGLPKHQLDKYYVLHEILVGTVNMLAPFTQILDLVRQSENGSEFLELFFDALYDVRLELKKFSDDEDCLKHVATHLDYVAEMVFTNPSPYAAVALGYLFIARYPKYSSHMVDLIERYLHPINRPDTYGVSRRAVNALKLLGVSEFVKNVVELVGNTRLMELWCLIDRENIDVLLPIPEITESGDDVPGCPSMVGDIQLGQLSVIMESMENDPETICARYDMYRFRAAQLEADLDLVGNYNELKKASDVAYYESASLLQSACEEEALMLEWEDDGSPNKIINTHIMTSKERAAAEEAKRNEKKSPINNLVKDNQSAETAAINEADLCEEIKKSIAVARKLVPADEGKEKEKNDEVLAGLRDDLSRYKRTLGSNDYKQAEKLISELKEEIVSADQTITEAFHNPKLEEQFNAFFEDSPSEEESSDETKAPRKPKEDLPTKIQNKALDYAAKDSEKAAKKTADRQKLKNAANAVSQKPKRVNDDLNSFVKKIDKWDENRRKEFLLKPGYRHKIFKYMRDALMFGAVAKVKLAYIPMLALLKHCSNLKDKRIRNELAKELDAEIRICEEKISDANGAGDNKSKYELMRIKDKLEAEKTRVRLNSKYI